MYYVHIIVCRNKLPYVKSPFKILPSFDFPYLQDAHCPPALSADDVTSGRGNDGCRLERAEPRGQLLHQVDVLLPARRADERGCLLGPLLFVIFPFLLLSLLLVDKVQCASAGRYDFTPLSCMLTRSEDFFSLLRLWVLRNDSNFFASLAWFLFGLIFGPVSVYINDRHRNPSLGVVGRCLRQQFCRFLGKQGAVSVSTRFHFCSMAWFLGLGLSSWIFGRHVVYRMRLLLRLKVIERLSLQL